MADAANRPRHSLWKRVASDEFRRQGFENASPRPERSFRQRLEDGQGPQSDIDGLPAGVFVKVAADMQSRFGVRLDEAETVARLRGDDLAVVLEYRREVEPGQAFAVLTLAGLAQLLRRAYPRQWATLGEFEADIETAIAAMEGEDG